MAAVDWKQFGGEGTIATRTHCKAAGGRFFRQLFGWMVYPLEKSKAEIWTH